MVFAGVYPVDPDEYEELRNSIERLQLNDASLTFIPESSAALGLVSDADFLVYCIWKLCRSDLIANLIWP